MHTLRECVGVEVWLPTLLGGGVWCRWWPGRFTPGEGPPVTYWTGGWVNRWTRVDASEKRKICCLCYFNACTVHLLLFLLQPTNAQLYRVIHKSLRNVWTRLRNNHIRHSRVDISSTCKVGQKLECLSLCWHAPLRRDHSGYCTAEIVNLGGTYELPCISQQYLFI